ncbi:hypothetical protein ACFQE1_06955 [Halobium palmae]|uniref:Uncharacterized protein n=1 Tax=Halobium palmae TaxID=1776492 RepID=A0ABD5RXT6_9EURY
MEELDESVETATRRGGRSRCPRRGNRRRVPTPLHRAVVVLLPGDERMRAGTLRNLDLRELARSAAGVDTVCELGHPSQLDGRRHAMYVARTGGRWRRRRRGAHDPERAKVPRG